MDILSMRYQQSMMNRPSMAFLLTSLLFLNSFLPIFVQFPIAITLEQFQSSLRAVLEQFQSIFSLRAVSEQFQSSLGAVSEHFQS